MRAHMPLSSTQDLYPMHLLTLCKRQYTARDLLTDCYGRLYEIPEALALRGHQVSGLTTSYRYRTQNTHVSPAGVHWQSVNLGPFGPWEWHKKLQQLRRQPPDVIWASSDALHCIAAIRLGHLLDIPVVLDLYDNYDHFGLNAIPGIRRRYHRACRLASALTIVSHKLAEHVRSTIAPETPFQIIGNGVNTDLFKPLNKQKCRQQLGLPPRARIIGTAGAIHTNRGIDDMFGAFLHLAKHDSALHLVIAGPQDNTPSRFPHPRIINLGMLDWRQVPVLINSLDIAVVCNRDDSFGRYCSPLKLQEALACGVPVCAAATGEAAYLLKDNPEMCYSPGDVMQLADRLRTQLINRDRWHLLEIPDWALLATRLEQTLQVASNTRKA